MKRYTEYVIILFFLTFHNIIYAQTYTVGTTGDYPTLANAITNVPSGSTLEILENQTCNNIALSKNLIIRKSPSVSGDILLNYNGTVRHFTINANTSVTFENLVFQGPNVTYGNNDFTFKGTTTSGGGLISSQATSQVTLNNCKIGGCATTAAGGAINSSGTVNINNSVISYNRGLTGGGTHCTGTLTVNNSIINNNTGTSTGGGINSTGANSSLILKGNVACNNNTGTNGGGIYKTNTTINTEDLTSLTVLNNKATATGGGIYISVALELMTSALYNISNNIANTNGGGIYASASLSLGNATISGNKAGYDGTSYVSGNNYGGGIYANNALTLSGSVTCNDNSAGDSGGGIFKGTNGTFNTSGLIALTVSGNTAYGLGTSVPIGLGGGIYTPQTLDLSKATNVTINNNSAYVSGGGIYATTTAGLYFKNATISGNTAKYDGGGIYAPATGTTLLLVLDNVEISNNKAGWDFSTNNYSPDSYNGGGVYALGIVNLKNKITAKNNVATGNGGAIYKKNTSGFDVASVTELYLDSNIAQQGNGGGIYSNSTENLMFSSILTGSISNNAAPAGSGGAICVDKGLFIASATFSNNSAKLNGGAMYTNGETDILNTTFSGNISSDGIGGAIYHAGGSLLDINKSTFNANKAQSGGAIGSNFNATTNSQFIANSTFFKNEASNTGGALYFSNNSKSVSIYYCTFNANQTTSNAGNAICTGTDNALILNGNIIYGNGSGNDTEIANASGITGIYNIIREQTLADPTNQNIPSGQGTNIFDSVDTGNTDTGVLSNNGGNTQTLMIKDGGLAHDIIPLTSSLRFGSSAIVDQRGNNRLFSQTDIGSIEISLTCTSRISEDPIVWYVDITSSSGGDGTNISNPSDNLKEVLENPCLYSGDTIKIASGTYYSTETDIDGTFNITKRITLLGGYESGFDEMSRDFTANPTILDGKGISYTVVYYNDNGSEFGVIDGITIQNGNAQGSNTQGYGAGLWANTGKLLISNSIIRDNKAIERGGGVYFSSETALTFKNVRFINNKSGYSDALGDFITTAPTEITPEAVLKRSGGAICASGQLELQGSIYFENNESGAGGGAIMKDVNMNFVADQLDTLTFISCNAYGKEMSSQKGNVGGGAICTMVDADFLNIKKFTMQGCTAKQGGGILLNNMGVALPKGRIDLKIANLYAEGCRAEGDDASDGGAIESFGGTQSHMLIKNSTFKNCYTRRYGGALGCGNGLELQGTVIFDGNIAEQNGGAITQWQIDEFLMTQLDTLIMKNNKCYGLAYRNGVPSTASSNYGGAAIWTNKSNIDFSSVKYVLLKDNYSSTRGGGICYEIASITLTLGGNTVFDGNMAGTSDGINFSGNNSNGGAIYTGGNIIIKGTSTFKNNAARMNGGAIYANAISSANLLDSITFQNNSCGKSTTGLGGAIYITANGTTDFSGLKYGMFSGNTATNGGALYILNTLTLINSTLSNNMATNSGGGIYAGNTGTIRNCTFDQNSANTGGGIFSAATSAITILNSTFTKNKSNDTSGNGGGAIYSNLAGDNINITFSSFTGNTSAGNNANAIYFADNVSKTLNGNIIYDNGTGSEMNIAPITANYNIIRDMTLSGTGNMTLANGNLDQIFTTGIPENNGGSTQTLMIKRGGYAQNYIPESIASSWATTDQRNNSRTEKFADVGAVELITTPMSVSFKVGGACIGDQIDLAALIKSTSNVRDTLYYYDSSRTLPSGTTITTSLPYSNQEFMRFISGDNIVLDTIMPYYVFDTASTWTPKNSSTSNWNDISNWSNGIPGPCTYVTIPGGVASYPVLEEASDTYLQPACDTIEFKFGGEVARTDYLNYNGAKVDLTINSNQWYMFSSPLQNTYPGDFYVTNPNPITDGYILDPMLFNVVNPQTGKQTQTYAWTGKFNNPDIPFTSGMGMAVWIDEIGTQYTDHNQVSYHFPKNDPFYYYYTKDGIQTTDRTGNLERSQKNRFIYEQGIDAQGNISLTASSCDDATLPVFIGNPFMSHLNFSSFADRNNTEIELEYKLAFGISSENGKVADMRTCKVLPDGIIVSTEGGLGNLIAPMQSFIVTSKKTNPQLVVNVSDVNISTGQNLRSDSSPLPQLMITAQKGTQTSKALLVEMPGASPEYIPEEDSYKLFPESSLIPVLVYTRSKDGYALDINTISDLSEPVPIGIRTSVPGEITLKFSGMEEYNLLLHDTKQGNVIPLSSQTEYTFTKDSGEDLFLDNRFYLTLKNTTAIKSPDSHSLIIRSAGSRTVEIFSLDGSLIKQIQILNTNGQLVMQRVGSYSESQILQIEKPGIYIIKAVSDKTSLVEKVIVY